MKRYKEISEFSDEDVKRRYEEQVESLQKLKLSHSVTPLDNPLEIRHVRRQVARIKTEMRKRELALNTNSENGQK